MELGGVVVVVQASELDVVARLEARLAPWRIDHPEGPVEPEISVVVGTTEDGRRSTNSVHLRGRLVRTTHSLDGALDTVVRVLHTYAPVPAGTVWMRARALERAGAVLLVSDTLREALDGHHRRVARAGFADPATSPTLVDPRAAEVLLPVGLPGATGWRRVPIAAAVVFAPEDAAAVSPAVRVTHATSLVTPDDGPTRGVEVQALVDLLARVPLVPWSVVAPHDVIPRLEAIAPTVSAARPAAAQSALSAARTSSS